MPNITVIIPFFNGHQHIDKTIKGIPPNIPIIVVDDISDVPYKSNKKNVTVMRMPRKGYFTGAVNAGILACSTDVLVLNQDVEFSGLDWLALLDKPFDMIGERINAEHPAFADGYIHGTFMFIRRTVINAVGLLNEIDYPLWGSTCEYQLRVARAGFKILPVKNIPGFVHTRKGGMGTSIKTIISREPNKKGLLLRTPPEITVLVPCYNQGRFLPDLVASLVGGPSSLGVLPQQSFASFDVMIIDDCSTDDTPAYCKQVADSYKGVKFIRAKKNLGKPGALNLGVQNTNGKYLTVIDADDMRDAGSLERLYRAQVKNPHSFIYDGIVAFYDGQIRPDYPLGVSAYDCKQILFKNHVHTGIMLPRLAWQECRGWPEIMDHGREDWAMAINLGLNGYCGIYLPTPGYLYRRENHNRTIKNTSPKHHQAFLKQLMGLFPDAYKKGQITMCCGNKGKANVMVQGAPRRSAPLDGGATILEYQGTSWGAQSFYGVNTGSRYSAGKSRSLVKVDKSDLTGTSKKPGLLELRENGHLLFRVYQAPRAEIPKAQAPKVVAVPQAQAPIVVAADEPGDIEITKETLEAVEEAAPTDYPGLPEETVDELIAQDAPIIEEPKRKGRKKKNEF